MPDDVYSEYLPLRRSDEPPVPSPYEDGVRYYADEDGVLRALQSDGTDTAVGGGGVQAVYFGNSLSVNNADAGDLPVNNLSTGTALLDISTPSTPTFLADGTYALTVLATGDALTAAGYALCRISVGGSIAVAYTQDTANGWGPTAVFAATAGAALALTLLNFDGAVDRNFHLSSLHIVKL